MPLRQGLDRMLSSGCCTNAVPQLQMAIVSLLDSVSAAHYSRHTFEGQGLTEKPLCIVSRWYVLFGCSFFFEKPQSRKVRGHWGVAERLAGACCCCEVVPRAAAAHAACLRSIHCKCKCSSIWQSALASPLQAFVRCCIHSLPQRA